VLFKINMYRLRSERAHQVRRRLRNLALVVLLVGISIVVAGLFLFALGTTNHEIAEKTAKLEAATADLREELGGTTRALSDEEFNLVRLRAAQVRWSDVMAALSELTLPEMWFTQLRLTEGSLVGAARGRTAGFHMEGRLKSGQQDQSLEKLMQFISAAGEDPAFKRSFAEVTLVKSSWTVTMDNEYLEFEIFCPLKSE
jgi:Tfp pilus assembly protein PilN